MITVLRIIGIIGIVSSFLVGQICPLDIEHFILILILASAEDSLKQLKQ